MVNEEVLFFLFEEGLGDFFKVLDAAFFLDFLEILVNQVHVLLVLINNLDFFLILGNQVSESQLQHRLSVNIFRLGILIFFLFPLILFPCPIKAVFNHVDIHLMLFQFGLIALLDPDNGLFHSLDGGFLLFDFRLFLFDFDTDLLDSVGQELELLVFVLLLLPQFVDLELQFVVF